ncbi:hypothetical protein ATY30_02475 [Sinorhizobium americanum]|nr:hypothetical protein CO664_27345 [Sinorhizobium sp. NG07B]POH33446.1 hypothetical protein ATY30_02475 [Sinorhizobium americanum]
MRATSTPELQKFFFLYLAVAAKARFGIIFVIITAEFTQSTIGHSIFLPLRLSSYGLVGNRRHPNG